jgi:hypothetical protein
MPSEWASYDLHTHVSILSYAGVSLQLFIEVSSRLTTHAKMRIQHRESMAGNAP